MNNYLDQIDSLLRAKGIPSAERIDFLAELKSHLSERLAEFQAQGAADPLAQTLAAFGTPQEITAEFTARSTLRSASRSYLPLRLLSATWRITRTLGLGFSVLLTSITGYALAVAFFAVSIAKYIFPEKVGFFIGEHGINWGISPRNASAYELAGDNFIPISLALAVFFALGTTFLLRKQVQALLAKPARHESAS